MRTQPPTLTDLVKAAPEPPRFTLEEALRKGIAFQVAARIGCSLCARKDLVGDYDEASPGTWSCPQRHALITPAPL